MKTNSRITQPLHSKVQEIEQHFHPCEVELAVKEMHSVTLTITKAGYYFICDYHINFLSDHHWKRGKQFIIKGIEASMRLRFEKA